MLLAKMYLLDVSIWVSLRLGSQVFEFLHSLFSCVYTEDKRNRSVVPSIIYNKPTRCNSGSFVFIKNYKYALHVSDALCVHLQEHYKL